MQNSTTYSNSMTRFFARNSGILIGGVAIAAIVVLFYIFLPTETVAVLNATVRISTPLVLGALCGLMGERAAVINIGIEGQMLMSAFVAFLFNVWTGNPYISIIPGVLTGALLGLLLAFMAVTLKIDQIIGGTVINILAVGVSGFLNRQLFFEQGSVFGGQVPHAPGVLPRLHVPFLADIPTVGKIFDQQPITIIAILLVIVTHFILFHTRWGLRTRAVGEHPRAADTVGINVFRIRYICVLISGALAGLSGAYMGIGVAGRFNEGMTAGKGFLGLAAMIFGNWNPGTAFMGSLIFGFFDSWQEKLAILQVGIPGEILAMAPYIATMIVLSGFIGRVRMPAADGIPYEK